MSVEHPYAAYLRPVRPADSHVEEAIAAGPIPAREVPPRAGLGTELGASGYAAVETGYGRTRRGELWVACLTRMPGVDPSDWDWWFGWHSTESERYRLWHPDAHRFAALRDDRSGLPQGADRERYVGNTSYVDEVIGGHLDQLAISFFDPARLGIDRAAIDGTVICGRVGTSLAPLNVGYVIHGVRRTAEGSEMRSRFYLGRPGVRRPDVRAAVRALRRGPIPPRSPRFPLSFGPHLLRHCAEEMQHLAGFLPELRAEFDAGGRSPAAGASPTTG